MRKNDILKLNISGYTTDGAGVSRHDGMVVFVAGALDGETVDARILKVGKNSAFAKIERIVTASPKRIAPDCPHYQKCGGCSLRHMSYKEELRMKKDRVQDALRRIGGLDIEIDEIIPSDDIDFYRNKAQYPVADTKSGPAYGFYRAGSHDLVPVNRCMLQSAEADAAAKAVMDWMRRFNIPAYDETRRKGMIRHVFVRTGVYETMVCIVAGAEKLPKVSYLIDVLRDACPNLRSIMLSVNKKDTNVVLGDKFITIWGDNYIDDTLMGLSFRLSPASFYQINRPQAEKLYKKAIELAEPGDCNTVLDLYCGTGTITLAIASAISKNEHRSSGELNSSGELSSSGELCAPEDNHFTSETALAPAVIGVEIVEAAVRDAENNAVRNGINNARFICADAAEAAFKLSSEGIKPDVVVLDPPRKGLSRDTIELVSDMSPKRIVYISCDPATLARDLKLFTEKGYRARSATALDMFPRCAHVETVVQLAANSQ